MPPGASFETKKLYDLLPSRDREHLGLEPDADIARHHVGDVQFGGLADERARFAEGEVFGEDLERIDDHRIRGQIDAGEQTLLHFVPVLFGEGVGHIRTDLNIELHNIAFWFCGTWRKGALPGHGFCAAPGLPEPTERE